MGKSFISRNQLVIAAAIVISCIDFLAGPSLALPLLEIARVLVRFNHVARTNRKRESSVLPPPPPDLQSQNQQAVLLQIHSKF